MTLVLHQLVASRNERALFAPLDCRVASGELLQVTGANGSGKSTLLRILAGLIQPASGSFEYPPSLHYIGHQNGLRPELTVRENLHLAAGLMGVGSERIPDVLESAGLLALADRPANSLSAGQARRLALTRLQLQPAALWLLDEPGTALDVKGQAWLDGMIEAHLAEGGMVVMATHEPVIREKHPSPVALRAPTSNFSPLPNPLRPAACPRDPDKCCVASGSRGQAAGRRGVGNEQDTRPTPTPFFTLLKYDLLQTFRNSASWLTPLLFFTMAITLFPLASGPDTRLLHAMAPSIVWVTAILAILLSIDNLFRPDRQTGWLDLALTSPCPLILPVLSKILSHWLSHGLPLVLLSPLFGMLLGLTPHEIMALFYSLLAGTPILSLTGAIGAALVAGLRGQALLLPVLIMPLYIPVLIFGASCVSAASWHQPVSAHLAILGALLLFTLTFSPLLAGVGLRSGVN